jgi:hypothetical protein
MIASQPYESPPSVQRRHHRSPVGPDPPDRGVGDARVHHQTAEPRLANRIDLHVALGAVGSARGNRSSLSAGIDCGIATQHASTTVRWKPQYSDSLTDAQLLVTEWRGRIHSPLWLELCCVRRREIREPAIVRPLRRALRPPADLRVRHAAALSLIERRPPRSLRGPNGGRVPLGDELWGSRSSMASGPLGPIPRGCITRHRSRGSGHEEMT